MKPLLFTLARMKILSRDWIFCCRDEKYSGGGTGSEFNWRGLEFYLAGQYLVGVLDGTFEWLQARPIEVNRNEIESILENKYLILCSRKSTLSHDKITIMEIQSLSRIQICVSSANCPFLGTNQPSMERLPGSPYNFFCLFWVSLVLMPYKVTLSALKSLMRIMKWLPLNHRP